MDREEQNTLSDVDHQECREKIKKISVALNKAIHSIEDRFLETGERLMGISDKAAELSSVIQSARDILDNTDHGVLAEYLRIQTMVMEKLQLLMDHVRQGQLEIRNKDDQITRFRDTCGFISVTSRNLSIIALNIKVQSGHLTENEDSFFSFGKEIKGLATELADVSNAINNDSLDTQKKQREQLKRIDYDLKRFEEYIEESSGNWSRIKSSMMLEIQELIPGFEKADECTQKITKEVSALVMALQGHDIVRQKVEHVCEILDEIAAGNRAPGKDILVLQAKQLELSLKELSRVKVTGVSAFTVIHKMLSDLVRFIVNDREEALSLGAILDDSLSGLLTLVEYLDNGQDICSHISTSIDEAMSRVKQLEQYVEKAKEVNQSLEMKAINAIVMTAGLKNRSRPFRVLGQHVNDLSRKSIVFADRIRAIIESIIADNRDNRIDSLRKEQDDVKQEVASLQEQYTALQEQIELSSSGSRELQQSILQAGDSLVFLNPLIETIQNETGELKHMYCGVETQQDENDTDAINRYTMESEREIYRDVYGKDEENGEAVPEEDSVTLF